MDTGFFFLVPVGSKCFVLYGEYGLEERLNLDPLVQLLGAIERVPRSLLYLLPEETKTVVRKTEKISYKKNICELAVIFNETCIKDSILPRYTNIRLHDPSAREDPDTAAFRRTPIRWQLNEKQQELLYLKDELHTLQARWNFLQEQGDRLEIEEALRDVVERDYNCMAAVIQRKLVQWNGGFLRIPRRKERSYIDLTNYTSSPEEDEALQLGLNCHVVGSPKGLD